MLPHPLTSPDIFQHVRMIMGMVVGLSVTRLLTGLVRIIQHPSQTRIYPVHIGWVLTLLLMLMHFWWWELWLIELPVWRFETYLFLILYAIILFFLSAFYFLNLSVIIQDMKISLFQDENGFSRFLP
ncbi:hypothetical protein ACE4RV_05795 [Acetobacter persici]|uniref:hypothetical protein n=1 Tax=Acetobacter persici TaxID=1076596 RepID=UPI0036DB3121